MSSEPCKGAIPPRVLTGTLAGLGVATIAALVTITFAPTPLPPSPSYGKPTATGGQLLHISGYELQLQGAEPAHPGRRLSRGKLFRFQARRNGIDLSGAEAAPLRLELVSLHSRSHTTFQLAALTTGADAPPGLSLRQRRMVAGSPSVAIGRLTSPGKGKPSLPALQTCLISAIPGSALGAGGLLRGGVSGSELKRQMYAKGKGPARDAASLWRDLQRQLGDDLPKLLGLAEGTRFQCLLVSVTLQDQNAQEPEAQAALLRFWRRAAPALAVAGSTGVASATE